MRRHLSSLPSGGLQARSRIPARGCPSARRPWVVLGLLAAHLATSPAQAADVVHFQSGTSSRVFLRGYESGKFKVMTAAGDSVEHKAATVRKIELEKPLKASIEPRAGKRIEDALIEGFDNGMLSFSAEGRKQTKPLLTLRTIDIEMSFDRTLDDLSAPVISHGESVDLPSKIAKGHVTVVHFHSPDVVASLRQGSYLARLANDSGGKLVALRIVSSDWSSEAYQQHKIKSLPQFWFYNANGDLAVKLTDRFTEEDIDAALETAGYHLRRRD
jgi:hypothetical protein